MKRFAVGSLILLLGSNVFGETIYLRNGEQVEGKIITKYLNKIIIQTSDGTEEIKRKYVKSIGSSQAAEPDSANAEPADASSARPEVNKQKAEKPSDNTSVKKITIEKTTEDKKPAEEVSVKRPSSNVSSVENTLKIGFDLNGTHAVAGSVVVGNSRVDLNGSQRTDPGFSLSGESIDYPWENLGLGFGLTFQFPRSQTSFSGNFNFIPVYGIVKVRMTPADSKAYFYGVGHLGYNFFMGDTSYTENGGTTAGGLYYGVGLGGHVKKVLMELLYTVNTGTIHNGGYVNSGGSYDPYELNGTIRYSRLAVSIGREF